MFKSGTTLSRNTILWGLVALLVTVGIVTLFISFASAGNSPEDVDAIYTNAAETLAAQQLTLEASQPTETPTATMTATPFETVTPFATLPLSSPQAFASPTLSAGSGAVGCNNSVYVSDVTIPDGTVMTPGQAFTKTWKVQNNGTCAWTATYKLTFVSGEVMGGVATPINVAVSPNQSVDISVAMTAPAIAGDHTGYWKIYNDQNQPFGTFLSVVIKVGAAANTAVPTTAVPPTEETPAEPTEEP
ncbi:MAG: NBR1-Ig-like domain-containing protein [Anaerolineales bacterium]|nr:NBR1-Ig-like domain-containing protein [Anaerolineales bacterium]